MGGDGGGARARQKARTRADIIRAAAAAWSESGVDDVPLATIAAAADVSERTLYNHFPNREALVAGLSEWITDRMHEEGFPEQLDDLDDLPAATHAGFRGFARAGDLAALLAQLQGAAHASVQAGRDENTRLVVALVEAGLGDLDPDLQRAVGLLLRALAGSRFWHHLTRELGMDDDLAAELVPWTIRVLIDAARAAPPGWPPAR